MTERRLVPKDLLNGRPLMPTRTRRLAVTGFVIHPDGSTWSKESHKRAQELWGERLNRPGRVSVASALIELEQLGVCRDIQEHDEHLFSVEV